MKIVLMDRDEPLKVGGISVYTKRLSDYLKQKKHEVFIFRHSNRKRSEPNIFHIPYYLAEQRSVVFLPREDSLTIIKKYLQFVKPDLIYLPLGLSTLDFFLPSVCHELNIPVVGVWHIDFNQSVSAYQIILKSLFLAYVSFCKQLDLLQLPSSKLAEFYTKRGVDPKKIIISSNGVDPDVYKRKVISNFAKKNNIKKGVCFLGRITLQKNPEVLIESFLAIDPAKDTKLVMIGHGELKEELMTEYDDKRIIFTDLVIDENRKVDILSACQTFVFPTRIEGMSLALLEAMSCGLACISSDAGSNKEVLGKAGIVIPSSYIKSQLPLAIKICLDYPVLNDYLRNAARERVLKYYSQAMIFDNLINRLKLTAGQFKGKNLSTIKTSRLDEQLINKVKYVWQRARDLGTNLFE